MGWGKWSRDRCGSLEFQTRGPRAGSEGERGFDRLFPGEGLTGGEGEGVWEFHGFKAHLWVA